MIIAIIPVKISCDSISCIMQFFAILICWLILTLNQKEAWCIIRTRTWKKSRYIYIHIYTHLYTRMLVYWYNLYKCVCMHIIHIYYKDREIERETDKENIFICWLTLQLLAIAGTGPGWRQKAGILLGVPLGGGDPGAWTITYCFAEWIVPENWMRHRAGTQTQALPFGMQAYQMVS